MIDAAVASTCDKLGKTEGKHCDRCSAVLVAQQDVAMKPHTEETLSAVEATCSQTGLTEGKKCSVCNAVITAQVTIPVKPHDNNIAFDAIEANCKTVTGSNKYLVLTVCKHYGNKLVTFVKTDCLDACLTGGIKHTQLNTLGSTCTGYEEDKVFIVKLLDMNTCGYRLAFAKLEKVDYIHTLCDAACLGNLITLKSVYPSLIGEEEYIKAAKLPGRGGIILIADDLKYARSKKLV